MELTPLEEAMDVLGPDPDEEWDVFVVRYDHHSAWSDPDHMTVPFVFDSLDDVTQMPEDKPGYEHIICHEDGRVFDYGRLLEREDAPDWFPE